MRGTWAIWKREARYYFSNPTAYVLIAVFLVIADLAFLYMFNYYTVQSGQLGQYSSEIPYDFTPNWVMEVVFDFLGTVILIMLPFVTMRLLAEERRMGTDELLLTTPVSISDIVLGKYLSALTLLATMLGLSIYMPILLGRYSEIAWKTVLCGYLGLFLMGAAFIAFGLFLSSVTESQVVAGLATFGLLLGLWLISGMGDILGRVLDFISPSLSAAFEEGLKYLSLSDHLSPFLKGIVDTRDLVFYLSAIFLGVFLAHRSVESTRWR